MISRRQPLHARQLFHARRPLRAVLTLVLLLGLLAGGRVARAGTFDYAIRIGGFATDQAAGVAVDALGNVYLTGSFIGLVDFDPGPGTSNLTGAGLADVFVVKLNPSGGLVWARRFGGPNDELVTRVAVDDSGNVYVTGSFTGTVDFDPGTGTFNLVSAGVTDIFVVKLNTSGNFVWADRFGGASEDEGGAVAVDAAGNVYLTGDFFSVADFDPGAGTLNLTSSGATDMFVVKLDANGNLIWAKRCGGSGVDRGDSITVDGAGNVYTTGYFSGTADFQPGTGVLNLVSAGVTDIFALKQDANGDLVWVRGLGGAATDQGLDIAVDGGGNVHLTGAFSGTVDFDPGTGTTNLTAAGFTDVFALKLSSGGNLVWARGFGGSTDSDVGRGLALDAGGNVYLTGYFWGTVDFDPGTATQNLTSGGLSDVFASKLDSSGNLIWARRVGGTGADQGHGLAMDGNGGVYLAGEFTSTVDFDPGSGTSNLTAVGGSDAFMLKLEQVAPPVQTVPGPQTTAEDTPLTFSTAAGNRISVADADAGSSPALVSLSVTGGTLTLSTTTGLSFSQGDGAADPSMMFTGTLAKINAALDGLVYQPVPNVPGSVTLRMNTIDQVGPSGGQSANSSVPISINPVNDPPAAANDAYNSGGAASLVVPAQTGVLANDTDVEGAALSAALVSGPAHGNLALSPDGSFTYTPQAGYNGADSFTYRASDGSATSGPATVSLTVTTASCTPRPPVTVSTAIVGGALQATVTATSTTSTPNNRLVSLKLDAVTNAQVTLNNQPVTAGQTVTLPANTTSQVFTVRRATPGQSTTVRLTATDTCGPWPTFVGGGTAAGF